MVNEPSLAAKVYMVQWCFNWDFPLRCRDLCVSKGCSYFALLYSTYCKCGNNRPSSDDKACESECNYNCKPDSSLMCGGFWRIGLYQIDGADFETPAIGEFKIEASTVEPFCMVRLCPKRQPPSKRAIPPKKCRFSSPKPHKQARL